jgi:hypothetical protein
MPIEPDYHGQSFFVVKGHKRHATLLLLVLMVVETTDVIFAVDSIPAIFAITQDPFIVYTSNVFAILGLRALYFMLAGIMGMFVYLKLGLSFVLCFVGIKMMLTDVFKIPIGASLAVIGGTLLLAIFASWLVRTKQTANRAVRAQPSDAALIGRPHPAGPFRHGTAYLWLAIPSLAAILILVKLDAVARGPAGREAITAISVVEYRMAQARWRDARGDDLNLDEADRALDEAWSKLTAKRYQESILAAQAAADLLVSAQSGNERITATGR